MSNYTTEQLRTIALVGHGAGGKTTLSEALLHRTGTIAAPGSVEKGTTVADFDPLEKQYQHSLNSSLLHFAHLDTHIHLIDTPRLPQFHGAGDLCAGRGGDGRGGGQRAKRHRAHHAPHDDAGAKAPSLPDDYHQQDRCGKC